MLWIYFSDLVVYLVYHCFHLLRIGKDLHASVAWVFEQELVFVDLPFENGLVNFSPVLIVVVFPVDRVALVVVFLFLVFHFGLHLFFLVTALRSRQHRGLFI